MNSKKQSAIGLGAREVLDVEVMRITQEKRHSHECRFVVSPIGDGMTHFVISVQSGKIRIQPQVRILANTPSGQFKRRRA